MFSEFGVVGREDGGPRGDKDDATMDDSVQGCKFFGGPGEAAGGPSLRQPPRITWSVSASMAAPRDPNWEASGVESLSASGTREDSESSVSIQPFSLS